MFASDILRTKYVTLRSDDTMSKAINKLAENDLTGAPVVDDDGRVVGILSENDILKAMKTIYRELRMVYPSIPVMGISFIEHKKKKDVFKALREISEKRVDQFMERRFHRVSEHDLIEDIIPALTREKVDILPVISEKGALMGVVTRGDIMGLLVKEGKGK